MTPVVEITGKYAARLNGRINDFVLVDGDGTESDSVTFSVVTQGLEDGWPQEGEKIGVLLGDKERGLIDKGQWEISKCSDQQWPSQMTIQALAAPLNARDETEFRKKRSASFHEIKLGELFRNILSKHKFPVKIESALELWVIDTIDQVRESDHAFLQRLAKRYDAIVKPISGIYVVARKGMFAKISGEALAPIVVDVVSPTATIFDHQIFTNARIDNSTKKWKAGCKAKYRAADKKNQQSVTVGVAPFEVLTRSYAAKKSAQRAALTFMRKQKRERSKITIDCPGDARFTAESLVTLGAGFKKNLQGAVSVDKVTLSLSKASGFRAKIEASLPRNRDVK